MRTKKIFLAAATAGLAFSLVGCGSSKSDDSKVKVDSSATFAAGSSMEKLNKAGKITIGVKYDQPGIGYLKPGKSAPEGFDIEIAKILAGGLGIKPDKITWKETISKNRQPFLKNGTVDYVVASYSITDDRRKEVGQTGPYYLTGQQLLVAKDDTTITGPEDLKGKKVCGVTGSTPIKLVTEKYGVTPVPFGTYTECVQQLVNKSVDAVTTDGSILLGYAADQPDKVKVVGKPFSTERYGVGFKHGDKPMCEFINKTLQKSFDDGTWKAAYDATLGKGGVPAPTPPKLDACS
jgi:glutamate transport system substrate-binding protein